MRNLKQQQKIKLKDIENRLAVARGGGGGWEVSEIGEGGQNVQTSSYKII